MKRLGLALSAGALLAFAASATATPAEELRELLAPMAQFGARFEQVVIGARGRTLQSAEGTVHLERPGRLRWEVTTPYPQVIVSNGIDLYVFDPDLAQVTVQPLAEAPDDTPGRLLTGALDELEALFHVALDAEAEGRRAFVLRSRADDSLFDHIRLEFTGPLLAGIDIVDHLDQVTELRFRDQTLRPALPPGVFEFIIPEGVDVIGNVASDDR